MKYSLEDPYTVVPDPGMSREVYYLAGPMSGKKDHNLPEFDRLAAKLRTEHKLTVVNPAELTRRLPGEPGDLPYEAYVKNDMRFLMNCDAIILMEDYSYSKGARCEYHIAHTLNMRVFFLDDSDTPVFSGAVGNPKPFGL